MDAASQKTEADPAPRKLDLATTATVDLVALNNKIVAMRPIVRKAKVQVVQKLTRNMQTLKKRKGQSEQVQDKFKRKWERRYEEIQAIKHLKPDRVSKFALGNTKTLNEVCKMPDAPSENRALIRLCENKVIQDVVKKFREDHHDWKSLAAFLLSRNSGRRYKKKKTNKVEKMITNVRAGEIMVKSFLEGRFEGTCAGSEKLESAKLDKLASNSLRRDVLEKGMKKSNMLKGKKGDIRDTQCTVQIKDVVNESDSSDNDDDIESDDEEEEESNPVGDDEDNENENDDNDESSDEEGDDDESHDTNNLLESARLSDQRDDENADDEGSDEKDSSSDERTSLKTKENRSHDEVVVKKISLQELAENVDERDLNTKKVPAFLTQTSSASTRTKKLRKDAFFVTSEGSDESDSDEDEEENETEERELSSDEDRQLGRGMKAFHSTFMGSLSEKKWRKTAESRRNKEMNKDSYSNKYSANIQDKGKHNNIPNKQFSGAKKSSKEGNKYSSEGHKMIQKKEMRSDSSKTGSQKVMKGSKEEKLHPSWVASKKRKEQTKIHAFQGKKIKFDDDD